jgi:hypothetical protein
MATICDGKHKGKKPAGAPAFRFKAVAKANGLDVGVDLRLAVKGKHFCTKCFVAIGKKLAYSKLLDGAKELPPGTFEQAERQRRRQPQG